MKRSLFLGAAGAVTLASCSGGHGVVPNLATGTGTGTGTHAPTGALTLVPTLPDPIPANVLAHPILGEARRFLGAAAPAGWAFMTGQALSIASNPSLFAILGHPPGDKATATFSVPNPGTSMILSVSGSVPASPQALASMRPGTPSDALGVPAPAKPIAQPKGEFEAAQLRASAVAARTGSPENLSPDTAAAMDRARVGFAGEAAGALDARTANVLRDAVAAAVDGRTTVYGAVTQVANAISARDASAALAINDRMVQAYSAAPAAHQDPQREAAVFLVTNAITPDQASAIAAREQ